MAVTVRKVYLKALIFFLVYFKATHSTYLQCDNTNPNCSCKSESSSILIRCPDKNLRVSVPFTIISEGLIVIACVDFRTFKISFLPMLDIKEIKKLRILTCPLSSTLLTKVLARFNLKKLDALEIYFPNNGSVGKDYFIGFKSLKSLKLNYMIDIDGNLFENMPNLESLDIKSNKIVIKTGIFGFTSKLQWLDISSNSLTSLPDTLFKNMPNLEYLDIKLNKIEVLKTGIFGFTPKLTKLDVSSNSLTSLPNGLFENSTKLIYLYLHSNNIEELQAKVFNGLENLQVLEMSNNKIETIHENVFKNTPRLVNVNFNNNRIKYIVGKLFGANDHLSNIQIANNSNVKLADFAFADMVNLTSIDLCMYEIDELPENLFKGSTNLIKIKLDKNNVKTLPTTLFKDLSKLSELHLNSSKIETIFNETFSNLKSLQFLYLQENFLLKITSEMFKHLVNLEVLDLGKNSIGMVKPFLPDGNKLKRLYLNNNFFLSEENPFNSLVNLESLDLSYNQLKIFSVNYYLSTAENIELLNLSYNKITYLTIFQLVPIFNYKVQIDVSNNQITKILHDDCLDNFLENYQDFTSGARLVSVNLSNNPIKCDCNSYNLLNYFKDLKDPLKNLIKIEQDNLYCDGPKEFKGRYVPNLNLKELMCPFEDFNISCSDSCNCYYRPYNDTIIVDCSDRNLTVLPEISINKCVIYQSLDCEYTHCFNESTIREVRLENNALESAPTEYDNNYASVTLLDLTNNQIKNITWIPQNISHLYLGSNSIEKMDYSLLKFLNSSTKLEKMTLGNNPWDCNCSAWNFVQFLRYNYKRVNMDGVNCAANNLPLLEILNKQLLCPTNTIPILVSCVVAIGTLLIAAIIFALYLKFNEEIKICLFAYNLCLCWVTEAELDKDKIYDAFISYSHEDEDFLSEHLAPVLESNGYKLCLHERDFIPGLTILEQISSAVRDSRRTVIVLSNNFLQSEWAKHEFQAAQLQAVKDGLPRIIIILYGEIDVELLDEDFKAYLKTNTYVKWGNKNFWDKLKYSLPHSNKRVPRTNDIEDPSTDLLRLNSFQQED